DFSCKCSMQRICGKTPTKSRIKLRTVDAALNRACDPLSSVSNARNQFRIEVAPAARFVRISRAQQKLRLCRHNSLCTRGRRSADHANGVLLVNDVGQRQKLRHRAKRLPPPIGVKAGQDDTSTGGRKFGGNGGYFIVKKLNLVEADNFGKW